MEYIDALNLNSVDLNNLIRKKLSQNHQVTVLNPHSMHNIAIGSAEKGRVIVQGSTGFYTGGFLEGTSVTVEGNAGWYAGDNMMDGELIITKNAGCNAGTYFFGGNMIIRGNVGSRAGYGMKGGNIIICGSAGRWAGQMTLGGKLIILGPVGKQVGESMYKGVIYVKEAEAKENLGGNVFIDPVTETEREELEGLFDQYEINASADGLVAIRPLTTGRHKYVLFSPELRPELSRKNFQATEGAVYE